MNKNATLFVLVIMIFLFAACTKKEPAPSQKYEWNNGYCSECGGELIWKSSGSKEHYECKICGKEYRFDGVKKKRR